MLYVSNPSPAPGKRRKNPDLLIVNPLPAKGSRKNKKGDKMARKRKKRSRRGRRKNPLGSIMRKNPFTQSQVKAALTAAAGGVGASALAKMLVEAAGSEGKFAEAVQQLGTGGMTLAVSALVSILDSKVSLPGAGETAAAAVAQGGLVVGLFQLLHSVAASQGLAGLGQTYAPELASYSPEFAGLGAGPNPPVDMKELRSTYQRGMGGYEALGNLYNSQRIGSFEPEFGMAGFVPEGQCDPIHQQCMDVAKHKMRKAEGGLAGYEGMGQAGQAMTESLFTGGASAGWQ